MKTLLQLLSAIVCICILSRCEGCPECQPLTHPEQGAIPINAYFNTAFYKNVISDGQYYLQGPVYQIVQSGSGTADEIGVFQIRLTCCWSATECIPGRSGGYLIDMDGNTLFIQCKENFSSSDFTSGYPPDQACITGRFEFTGGTGRFEGAAGEGVINCLVTRDGNNASMAHHWKGTLKFADLH